MPDAAEQTCQGDDPSENLERNDHENTIPEGKIKFLAPRFSEKNEGFKCKEEGVYREPTPS
jgi:hypothetical protein